MNILSQITVGLLFSVVVGWLAYRRGSLSRSGVAGAIIIGTSVFGFGGWVWGLTLITFFVTSSLLSHYKLAAKEKLAEKFDKGHQRDLSQALANGGAAALAALLYAIWPGALLLMAFAGAMAAVNADTWATELGVLAKHPPRMITTLRRAEVGTSGAVSLVGTLASIGGALVIGLSLSVLLVLDSFFSASTPTPIAIVPTISVSLLSGFLGSLFDSLLGATVQAIYSCPSCQKQTEKMVHTCGTSTRLAGGWRWLNNDMVNFISSVFGAIAAVALYIVYETITK